MTLFAVVALLAAPAQPPLAPLVERNPTAAGNMEVSFGVQSSGTDTVGFTYFPADNFGVLLNLGLNATFTPSTPAGFSVELGVRYYSIRRDRVGLFLQPSVLVGRDPTPANNPTELLRLAAAVGVEYFFTDNLSAGGQLGLALNFLNLGSNTATLPEVVNLSTGTSGIFLNIYF